MCECNPDYLIIQAESHIFLSEGLGNKKTDIVCRHQKCISNKKEAVVFFFSRNENLIVPNHFP